MRHLRLLAILVAALAAGACASRKDPGLGTRVLDCVVVEREHEASGAGGSSSAGSGSYYLVFETRVGQATARYRYLVNRTQWFRFTEGSRVRITLNNNILMDVRPAE